MKSRLAPKIAAVVSSLFLGGAYVSCHQNGGSLLPGSKSRSIRLDAAGGVATTQETAAAPASATRPALLYSSKSKSPIFTPETLPPALVTGGNPRVLLPSSKSGAVVSEDVLKKLISPATQPVIFTAEPAGPPVPTR